MPRKTGRTPFRKTQAHAVLEGIVRTLAPRMQYDNLREVLLELAADHQLWLELELQRHPVQVHGTPTMPAPSPLMEPVS